MSRSRSRRIADFIKDSTSVELGDQTSTRVVVDSANEQVSVSGINATLNIDDTNNGVGGTAYTPSLNFIANGTEVGSISYSGADMHIATENYNSSQMKLKTAGITRQIIHENGDVTFGPSPLAGLWGSATDVGLLYDASYPLLCISRDSSPALYLNRVNDTSSGGPQLNLKFNGVSSGSVSSYVSGDQYKTHIISGLNKVQNIVNMGVYNNSTDYVTSSTTINVIEHLSNGIAFSPRSNTSSLYVIATLQGVVRDSDGAGNDIRATIRLRYYDGSSYGDVPYGASNYVGDLNGAGVNGYQYFEETRVTKLDQAHLRSDTGQWYIRWAGESDYAGNYITTYDNNLIFIEVED